MNNIDTSNQPVALTIIADVFGCDRADTALLASVIASGLAGARAGLRSGLGFTSPGFSVVCASDDPAMARLLKHLIEPANYLQTHLRSHCRSVSAERLDIRTTVQRLGMRVEPSVAEVEIDPFQVTPVGYRRLQAVLHPTMMVTSPDTKTYARGLQECADRSPFVFTEGFPAPALATALAQDCAGGDHIFEGPQGSIEKVHSRLLISCKNKQLQTEFRARNPILDHVLIAGPSRGEKRTIGIEQRRQAESKYVVAIKESIRSRHCGSGVTFAVKDHVAEFMDNAAAEIDTWVCGLDSSIRPYLCDASSLPMRLLWSFTLFAIPSDSQLHIGAVETARAILCKSATLLESLARAGYDDEEIVMLGKLNEKPQPFRGLVRRYSRQQRAVHEPVLGRLMGKGYVAETNNLLQVTEPGREHLNHAHMSMRAS